MTEEEALDVVCVTGWAWAQEYGFSQPVEAMRVWEAAKMLRPDLEPDFPGKGT